MVFFFLCIISIVEVYSSSSTLTFKSGSYYGPVLRHTGLLLVGVLFMIITMNIKCKYFKIVTPFALVISLAMLIVVLMMGQSTNGAARWIGLFGIQFQPSELAKGALILAEAQILSAMQCPAASCTITPTTAPLSGSTFTAWSTFCCSVCACSPRHPATSMPRIIHVRILQR